MSILSSLPSAWRQYQGPTHSLHPLMHAPAIQIDGTLVRPVRAPSSARRPGPSSRSVSSIALYGTFFASRRCFALMQKGHLGKENMTTGSDAMRRSSSARAAASS